MCRMQNRTERTKKARMNNVASKLGQPCPQEEQICRVRICKYVVVVAAVQYESKPPPGSVGWFLAGMMRDERLGLGLECSAIIMPHR